MLHDHDHDAVDSRATASSSLVCEGTYFKRTRSGASGQAIADPNLAGNWYRIMSTETNLHAIAAGTCVVSVQTAHQFQSMMPVLLVKAGIGEAD